MILITRELIVAPLLRSVAIIDNSPLPITVAVYSSMNHIKKLVAGYED